MKNLFKVFVCCLLFILCFILGFEGCGWFLKENNLLQPPHNEEIQSSTPCRATLIQHISGVGFVITPATDQEAYDLERLIGNEVRITQGW